jgi:deazaflavin-dependent oxidoreductase (nitroreductase family)
MAHQKNDEPQPDHPRWYLNLVKNLEIELQVGANKFIPHARTATRREKPRLWKLMCDIFPCYDEYQAKASRDIPVVIVAPV